MKIKFSISETNPDISPEEIISRYKEESCLVWLDSSLLSQKLGRYSFIGVKPLLTIKGAKSKPKINDEFNLFKQKLKNKNTNQLLKYILDHIEVSNPFDIPFASGLLGYFGYEYMEENEKQEYIVTPDSFWMLPQKTYIFDHLNKTNYECTADNIFCSPIKNAINPILTNKPIIENELTFDEYKKNIEIIKNSIYDGDIYECCFTHKIKTENIKYPLDLYIKLRKNNPAPFSAYIKFDDIHVLCCSPERFLKTDGNKAEMRPIKGTMRRGKNKDEDKMLKEELKNSIKNQAENIMIVDLIRNDLGSVCKFNSINVDELFKIEEYSSVFQMVSTISGTLLPDKDFFDLLDASFPGGSMTGAPKIRAMEYIEKLEKTKRGIYSGAIGYIDSSKNSDLNIVIRTIIYEDKQKKGYIQVGGAIVYDSTVEEEYAESLIKANKLISTIKGRY